MFYCFGSQAQQNVSELVEKAFANSRKDASVKQEIITDLISIDKNVNNVNVNQDIKQSKYIDFNKTTANELIAKNSETLSIQVIDDFGKPLVLDLINTGAFFENLKITTGSNKTFDFKQIKSVYYAGVVRGSEKGSIVSVSIFENELVGIVSIAEIGNLVIGKMKNSDLHIVYNDKAVANKFDFKCVTDTSKNNNVNLNKSLSENLTNLTSVVNKCVRTYLEIEYDIFQDKGSVANVMSYITAIHNQSSTIFLNEGINTPLSEIKIWDIVDPFIGLNASDLKAEFRLIRFTYNGDVAQILTFRPLGGGVADFGLVLDLCVYPQRSRLSACGIYNVYNNIPVYSWTVNVITHEFGHVFGSPHTFDCYWNGNNTGIDGCVNATCPFSNVVPPVPSPSVGGTIMSYCHWVSSGINFSNGIGPQPGTRIRTKINNSSCLPNCVVCLDNLTINTQTIISKYLQVSNNITVSEIVNDNLNLTLKANDLFIRPGFVVKSSLFSNFIAMVDPCTNSTTNAKPSGIIFSNSKSLATTKNNYFEIEGLEIYPNPLQNDKLLYIKSLSNLEKEVIIYNFSGKQVINTTTYGNPINVSELSSGIYIVKVSENGKSNTLKLVIQ